MILMVPLIKRIYQAQRVELFVKQDSFSVVPR